jgi:hypothetical protein
MIIIIQTIVVIVALALILSVLTGRQTHAARAWKKIALILLAFSMVIAVLFPEITNMTAHFVGVGRGADLLLYILTLAFISYVLNNYLYQQKDKDAIFRLARKVAVLDANERYAISKKVTRK